ncbi:MAG: lipid IV(A) 3-deoxy-D-manno-octulosonic acid transferase [Methylophilus sp.]|nr:lipid IV(A) 3-deoxy-D-manno-octulosonic acid transferase [Methylophilus sp.]
MNRMIYTFLLCLALPFVPLKLLWRGLKQPEYLKHWKERFGFFSNLVQKPVIWMHCVSVGETRAAEPLVHMLQAQYPHHQILITNTTPTGRAMTAQLFNDSVISVYLPYDIPFAVNQFLNHFQPKIGLLMETELWFNLIAACDHRKTPLILLNARLSEKSAKGYAKLGSLIKSSLQKLTLVAAQSAADEERFKILGAHNTVVMGNLKFDVSAPQDTQMLGQALRSLLGNERTIFVAASTREGEEELILDAIKDLDVLTVIVPRHPERFDEVEVLLTTRHIKYALRSELHQPLSADIKVVLGNTMGEMFVYYAACDFAFVGGSLLKFGGHNLIEVARMGKPILIGKYTYNFAEATVGAVQSGAATQVKDIENFRSKIQYLIEHPEKREQMGIAALNFSKAKTGATHRVMKEIEIHLSSVEASL